MRIQSCITCLLTLQNYCVAGTTQRINRVSTPRSLNVLSGTALAGILEGGRATGKLPDFPILVKLQAFPRDVPNEQVETRNEFCILLVDSVSLRFKPTKKKLVYFYNNVVFV